MYKHQEMIIVNGEEIQKAVTEKGLKYAVVASALGASSSLITNAKTRNKMDKKLFYDMCVLIEEDPKRFLPEARLNNVFNYKYDDEPEEPNEKPKFPVPQEGDVETRTGKILNGLPKKVEPKKQEAVMEQENEKNKYVKMWMELKKALANLFVGGAERDIADIIGIVTDIEKEWK